MRYLMIWCIGSLIGLVLASTCVDTVAGYPDRVDELDNQLNELGY